MNATTTNIIIDSADYFVADLNNGGVRIGMKGVCAFDFPADHEEYSRVRSADMNHAEGIFDEFYVKYVPLPTDGYSHLK